MKRSTFYTTIGLSLLLVNGEAYSGAVSDRLHISATVAPKIEYRILTEASALKITPADLKKGYHDVHMGTFLTITTNDPNGYLLSIQSQRGEGLVSITVTVEGSAYNLSPTGSVEIPFPFHGLAPEKRKLSYRFHLAPNAKTGIYPWPIIVTVHPI